MRWKNLRKAGADSRIERRRGAGAGGKVVKGGLGSILMAVIAIFVFKQDPQQVIGGLVQNQAAGSADYRPSANEAETEQFLDTIKASTDDVWSQLFQQAGKTYKIPRMVDYDVRTRMSTGGIADARMGPFYLPAEETIYIDINFFNEMKQRFGGGGDFAYAYVISHEVGHHVQHLLGKTDMVHRKKGRIPERDYNRLSVRLELQADFLSGIWAHYADKDLRARTGEGLLQEGDIQEAMRAAKAIGDDALQRQAGGRVVEDSFTHGTSEQRLRWFMKGLRSGDLSQMDTFSIPYEAL